MPQIMTIAAAHCTGVSIQPGCPSNIPTMIMQKNGPQKEYAPLQTMPSAAPHIELPLYQKEYAGMNSLYWDIAGYILESRLPAFAIDYLLQHYFQRPVSDDELMKIKISMLEQDFLWTNWALIRHYNGDDFLDYCAFRYERLRKNMDLLKEDMHADLKNLVL